MVYIDNETYCTFSAFLYVYIFVHNLLIFVPYGVMNLFLYITNI